jgi:hypothetical protein
MARRGREREGRGGEGRRGEEESNGTCGTMATDSR